MNNQVYATIKSSVQINHRVRKLKIDEMIENQEVSL